MTRRPLPILSSIRHVAYHDMALLGVVDEFMIVGLLKAKLGGQFFAFSDIL